MSRRHRYVVTADLPDKDPGNLAPKRKFEPELTLMAAILEEALRCFPNNVLGRTAREKKLFEEAQAWILAEGNRNICSFENVCMALDINPRSLRQQVMAWKSVVLQARRTNC